MARPTKSGAPTNEQLKTYRQAGEREFQALARAREAELRAIVVEKKTSEATRSLPAESVHTESTASPVEVSTGDAMRL